MATAPTDGTGPAPPPARRPAARVARAVGQDLAWAGVFWAAILLGLYGAGLAVAVNLADVEITASAWIDALGLPRYVLLAGGVVLVTSHLPVHLAHGITRRDFLRGAVPVGLALAAGAAALGTLVLVGEGALYDALGWDHVLDADAERALAFESGEGSVLYDAPDQYGAVLVDLLATYGLHMVTGLLIGAGYVRGGGLFGTLFLPVAVLPAAVGEVVLGGSGPVRSLADGLDVGTPPAAVAVALAVAAGGAGVAGLVALLRRAPFDPGDVHWWR